MPFILIEWKVDLFLGFVLYILIFFPLSIFPSNFQSTKFPEPVILNAKREVRSIHNALSESTIKLYRDVHSSSFFFRHFSLFTRRLRVCVCHCVDIIHDFYSLPNIFRWRVTYGVPKRLTRAERFENAVKFCCRVFFPPRKRKYRQTANSDPCKSLYDNFIT